MKNIFESPALIDLANAAATETYGAIALGTAGATFGAVGGGLMGAMGHNKKDVSVRALATLFGAAIGAVKGAVLVGAVGAGIGAKIGLNGAIDIAKTPFIATFNALSATTSLASNIASSTTTAVTDFVSQNQVAIVATAVAGAAYYAYNSLSDNQKEQVKDSVISVIKPKEPNKLTNQLIDEEKKLKENFNTLRGLIKVSSNKESKIFETILDDFLEKG